MTQPSFFFPPDLHSPSPMLHPPSHHGSQTSSTPHPSLPPIGTVVSTGVDIQPSSNSQATSAANPADSRQMGSVTEADGGFHKDDGGGTMGDIAYGGTDQNADEGGRLMGHGPEKTNRNSLPKTTTLATRQDSSSDDTLIAVGVAELSKELGLAEWQHNRLTKMAMTPFKLGEDVPLSTVLMNVMSTASYFDCFNRSVKDDNELAGYRAVLKEMRIVLNRTFSFDQNQKGDMRAWLRYKIWDPYRRDHKEGLVDAVVNHILKNAGALNYGHIVDIPHRVTLLRSTVQELAKSVRNGFRADIRNSCDLEKVIDVEAFIKRFDKKYMFPGVNEYKSEGVVFKIMMLRRFVVDNPDMVWADEEATGTRKKGECFWSKFDSDFAAKAGVMGPNIWADTWVEFRKELVHYDRHQFPGQLTAGEAKKRKLVENASEAECNGPNKAPRLDGSDCAPSSVFQTLQTPEVSQIPQAPVSHAPQADPLKMGIAGNPRDRNTLQERQPYVNAFNAVKSLNAVDAVESFKTIKDAPPRPSTPSMPSSPSRHQGHALKTIKFLDDLKAIKRAGISKAVNCCNALKTDDPIATPSL
ncbi:hypothetical protein V5O48_013314 [Marasmius crinis-equi]|uniref:Uncharacterized protein n=1 Tax=Marasmius crinis-equi TaxID=585013 RepID=A0ABR3F0F7_9AGAR